MALQHAVPTIFPCVDFTVAAGLMSYGTSIVAAYRLFTHLAIVCRPTLSEQKVECGFVPPERSNRDSRFLFLAQIADHKSGDAVRPVSLRTSFGREWDQRQADKQKQMELTD